MSELFEVLETCLQEIENGAEVETVLASHPHHAAELRPILNASMMARRRGSSIVDPSPEAVRRGRAKVLQHAAQMREAKAAPRRRAIPIFHRLAIALTLAALFLTSGTGLVSASSSALPGENLYPVKLTWENLRLFFTFDKEYRETLEHTFENERLHEINELLVEGRHETIQFAGIYMEVNGTTYVSGIHIVIMETSILPTEPLTNGAAVVVTGRTNAQGFVDAENIELLPAGTVVPEGQPVEVEAESDADSDDDHISNGERSDSDNDNESTAAPTVDTQNENDEDGAVNEDDNQNDDGGSDDSNDDNTDADLNVNEDEDSDKNDSPDSDSDDDNKEDRSGSGGGGDDGGGDDGGGGDDKSGGDDDGGDDD